MKRYPLAPITKEEYEIIEGIVHDITIHNRVGASLSVLKKDTDSLQDYVQDLVSGRLHDAAEKGEEVILDEEE